MCNMDKDDVKVAAVIGGGCVGFTGFILILVLIPLSFSYIERQHVGFKKNTLTNNVDKSRVYESGRHHWGLGKTAVQFPSTWQFVAFRGAKALRFFTDAGEIDVEISFYYRIRTEKLAKLYNDFGLAYENRIISIAQAELRNAAVNFTTRQYQEERTTVKQGLFDALAATLPAKASVEVNTQYFFLERIALPSSVIAKRLQVFVNTQLQITQEHNQTATQTRLNTRMNETTMLNSAAVILQNATRSASRMREAAQAKAFALIQQESGRQLSAMRALLSVTSANMTDALVKYNKLLDTVNATVLHNVATTVLQRT